MEPHGENVKREEEEGRKKNAREKRRKEHEYKQSSFNALMASIELLNYINRSARVTNCKKQAKSLIEKEKCLFLVDLSLLSLTISNTKSM